MILASNALVQFNTQDLDEGQEEAAAADDQNPTVPNTTVPPQAQPAQQDGSEEAK